MTPASAASSPVDSRAPVAAENQTLPEVLRRIGRLEVRAARVVDGFLTGRHHSPYLGRSLEFREHRQYATGDDLRHVDWKVYGRQDRLYVKQYEEETNLRAMLLVDCSASMSYRGDADAMSKHEYAATAACALAHLLTSQHDAVACRTFADKVIAETPHRTGRTQVTAIAEILEKSLAEPGPAAKTDLASLLRTTADSIPKRGIVVLLSDLLAPADLLADGLSKLSYKGIDTIVLQVLAHDEVEFPLEGATRFVSLEGEATLDANPRALRDDYLTALAEHQRAVETVCARHGAEHRLIQTCEALDAALIALLAARMRRPSRR